MKETILGWTILAWLSAIMAVLKTTGVISWAWATILFPLWGPVAFALIACAGAILCVLGYMIFLPVINAIKKI